MTRHIRVDIGAGRARIRRTPQGFVKLDANLTRTGVLEYRQPDGSVIRELRHPDDVFDPESLETLANAPVTDMHPSEMVSPENVKSLQVGTVTEAKRDGRFVKGQVIIQDSAMIEKVYKAKARELSPGYTCDIVAESGVYEGQRYDQRQTRISYNHVAAGPVNWGRSGPDVALRLDGASYAIEPLEAEGETMEKETESGSEKVIARLDAELVETKKQRDELSEKIGQLQGEKEALSARLADAEARFDAATSSEAVHAMVAERMALEKAATVVLGEDARFDGKTNAEIRLDAIRAVGAYSAESIERAEKTEPVAIGMFEGAVKIAERKHETKRDSIGRARDAIAEIREDSDVIKEMRSLTLSHLENKYRSGN